MGHGAREAGHRLHQFAQAFFDALGYHDLAFAGQQFDGAHLAHVHAHRVRRATGFVLHGSQGSGGFGGGHFIGVAIAFIHQQGVGIGRGLVDLHAHVVDHLNDVFHLIRIGNGFRQVVVDLGVGQIPLFFPFGDQGLEAG